MIVSAAYNMPKLWELQLRIIPFIRNHKSSSGLTAVQQESRKEPVTSNGAAAVNHGHGGTTATAEQRPRWNDLHGGTTFTPVERPSRQQI
ncbi:uncharacterized protein G2W53_001352 [Senna tora]|uniref:Uncharacterized protein n=1 Tax=Senna tora TaxID=362788 RepID=A0A834XHR1_9FABA|nr:uncharacterized protein G2W53_001352 [Senna tora]